MYGIVAIFEFGIPSWGVSNLPWIHLCYCRCCRRLGTGCGVLDLHDQFNKKTPHVFLACVINQASISRHKMMLPFLDSQFMCKSPAISEN